ncbi:hypothetical protein GO986_21815 [Deinococcus sp. HMF7620]|uniref:Uncharacterized protein n=1 Tax=Deinococcus arboris TaxID=2682977 RepID=A0A7C9LRF5_9DEIO|nr:hypothetical protein [Deinococcus arboris]MVN89376.1 hypothetical protein [Deinococcus arboris]
MTGGYPFQALGQALRTTLTADRLTPAQQVLGILSGVAYFDGPLGHLLLFKGGDLFRFYLHGRHAMGVAGGTPAGPVVVDLAAAGHTIIRSPRPAPAFPTTGGHPDVLAYTSADGGTTWLAAPVNAVNFDAGTVTVERPGNATRVAVYFTTGDGEFELRVVRPLGSDVASAKLFGGALRSIHETNQVNAPPSRPSGAPAASTRCRPSFAWSWPCAAPCPSSSTATRSSS